MARTVISPNFFSDSIVGCGSVSRVGSTVATVNRTFVPYLNIGSGFELSYGAAFVRAEAELQSHMFAGSTWVHTVGGTLGGGLRF